MCETMASIETKHQLGGITSMNSPVAGEVESPPELRRELKPRQVFMFSIACAIGTGLIIGSGGALAKGGPGSTLIAYILIGTAVLFVMTALGEMAAFLPMNKGFGGYATRMVDPAFG
jgi:amino acid transporter